MPDWVVYIFMQAQDMPDQAEQLLVSLEKGLSEPHSKDIHVCLDIHEHFRTKRFIINQQGKVLVHDKKASNDQAAALKEGFAWAFSKPSQKRMLIFSGHGTGILNPRWDKKTGQWLLEPDSGDSPYYNYLKERDLAIVEELSQPCDCKSLLLTKESSSCLTHQDLVHSLKYLYEEVLKGHTIDIIGCDACHMALLEVAWDLKPYARFFIASQESEEKEGWDYETLIRLLKRESYVSKIVRAIVFDYAASQEIKGLRRYSLSALDLSSLDGVVRALDKVAGCLLHICDREIVIRARHRNQRFCLMPQYADLFSFFDDLLHEIDLLAETAPLSKLKDALIEAKKELNWTVLASAAGPDCLGAHGCSVYFPRAHIDGSYLWSQEKKEGWCSFLRFFCGLGELTAVAEKCERLHHGSRDKYQAEI